MALGNRTCYRDENVYICADQYGSHQSHMALEYLKCGLCDWGIAFRIIAYLILINCNLNDNM